MKNLKPISLFVFLIIIAGSIFYLESKKSNQTSQLTSLTEAEIIPVKKEDKANQYLSAKEITTPNGFINTDGISINELIGKKVILVDFWTYSCINCQRTTPYLNDWYEKYKDYGLEIIGIHTPEFEFEQDYDNVLAAVEKFNIKYPVVLDNDYSTWQAYRNRYWPRKYLIDIDGYIVYDHIGEGAYSETERKIQALLKERQMVLGMAEEINDDIGQLKEAANSLGFTTKRSPEIYFGADRNDYLGNGQSFKLGSQTLFLPAELENDTLYLEGQWHFQKEFAEAVSPGAKIVLAYQAKDVYLVAGAGQAITIEIIKDGRLIGTETITDHKLYHLIQDAEIGRHNLEIIIDQPGLKVFTFTFG